MNLKKELGEVANAVTKIMDEALKGSQHKIDANKNNKIDAHDFKLLRAKKEVKKEDVESVEEGYYKDMDTNRKEDERLAAQKKKQAPFTPDKPKAKIATPGKFGYGYSAARHLARQGMAGMTKEESEQIAEDVTVKKDYDDNEQSEHGVYKGKKQIGYVVHNKKENTHTAYHGPQGRDDFGHIDDFPDHNKAVSQIKKSAGIKEDIQKTSTGYIHHARPGVYGGSAKEKHVVDTLRGPKKSEIEAIEKEKKMKTKKSFSEMVELYNEIGLKSLTNMLSEEPDNEQFTQELKDQEAKAAGKGKKSEVAKGAVQAVRVEEEVEQLDELSPKTLGSYVKKAHRSGTDNSFDHGEDEHRQDGDSDDTEREKEMQDRERAIANREKGIGRAVKKLTKEEQIKERSLTEPEMKKKEEIVKSMKKGLSGFKARYGDRAKEVMYATATKQAKGE
jgi:hypothetical protein